MGFPSSPTNGQQVVVNYITYVYNSTKGAWLRLSTPGVPLSANSLVLTSPNVSISTTSGALIVTGGAGIGGNLHADRYYTHNGLYWANNNESILNGLTYGNVEVAAYLRTYTGNVQVGNITVTSNAYVTRNIFANVFYTTNGIRWAGNGNVFASGGGSGTTYTANTAPPVSGNVSGDMWYNTNTDILYEYLNDGTSSYWVDVQSLGQTGNITTISDATLAGNIVVSLNNTISIGGPTGYLANIFVNNLSANTQTISGNITAGNVVTGIVSATGNITAANVTVSGNIQAAFVQGDGSKLTNLNAATTGKAIAMAIVFGG